MSERKAEHVIGEEPERLARADTPLREQAGLPLWLMTLTALGVVFGDIGTSPLYALRKCFEGPGGLPPDPGNVMGALSLIFWALMIIISVKYVLYIMRAGNRGEGGILALLALLSPWGRGGRAQRSGLIVVGLFGASLIYGDGMITPAISVLSAVEGLEIVAPSFSQYVLPVTVLILVVLFLFQQRGTSGVGAVFGPVMVVWFVVLAVLGVYGIVQQPAVLAAVNPIYGIRFLAHGGLTGFLMLGAVFLVVTGGEALYADMGHFGPRPIRVGWFTLVLPALLLNYFGQGALLLDNPDAAAQPFYLLAPPWARSGLVALATVATIIASQAVISAAFSLTRQAVLLGMLPRMRIVHTSSHLVGQIYIPVVNWVLMIATIGLVLGFKKSTALAGAYGVAVSMTMVITTILAAPLVRERWGWSLPLTALVTAVLLVVDVPMLVANLFKIVEGGWFPLAVGAGCFVLMTTWRRGRDLVARRLSEESRPVDEFLTDIAAQRPLRVPGTAVFMTGHSEGTPPILPHHLMHNKVLHEQVVLCTLTFEDSPRVAYAESVEVQPLGQGFYRVIAHCGFMQTPDVPGMLARCARQGLRMDPARATYYVTHNMIFTRERTGMAHWRKQLFRFMARNAADNVAFYNLPAENVFELGVELDL